MPDENAQLQPATGASETQPDPAPPAPPTDADRVDAVLDVMRGKDPDTDPAPELAPAPPAGTAGSPAAPPPAAATDAAAPPAATPAVPPAPADPDAARIDAEIAELGIKNERTAARFRELSTRVQEGEVLRARMDELQPRLDMLDEWENRIVSTGASPEQFASSMGYLGLVNSGDPANMERAFSMIEDEYRNLGRLLGKDVAGIDPLDDHPDLKAKVASNDMDRADALRWAEERNKTRIASTTVALRDESSAKAKTVQEGLNAIAALGAELRATDPMFEQKFAMIAPLTQQIQQTLPPNQWAQAVRDMWAKIPSGVQAPAAAPAPAAPPAAPKTRPLRPGVGSAGQIRNTNDPIDGFLAAAAGHRPV